MKKISSLIIGILFGITTVVAPIKSVSANTVQNPITRSEAEERALKIINLTWTYDKNKNGNLNPKYTSYVTAPSQFDNVTTAQFTGIPYNWGGQDSLDSKSINAPWTNFLDGVNKGAYTGNVNTEAGMGYISGTAGIDCSGFVQAVFNIQDYKISTSTMFDKYFKRINLNELKHMDILNRAGDHVLIFDKWGTLNGISGAYTYESTWDQVFGGIQGTKKYFVTMDDINNGYIPGRYINVVDDSNSSNSSQQSSQNPVKAGQFAQVTKVTYSAYFKAAPSDDAALLGTVPKGTILYLIDQANGWYLVNYNGKTGWVWGELFTSIPSGKYVTVNNVYQLNIRSNPSSTASILGVLGKNQYAEVLDYSKDGNWVKIKINGIEGFSSRKYLNYIY